MVNVQSIVQVYNPYFQGENYATAKQKKQCQCTIIPPHMSERIGDAYDDDVLKENAERVAARHFRLRNRRAKLFSGEKSILGQGASSDEIVKIYDAKHKKSLPGTLVVSPAKSSDVDVLEAYEWSVRVNDFYQNVFGRKSIDNQGMEIVSTVHYDNGYNNAFWQGNQMVYGDGDDVYFNRFTIDSDIAAHEMTHGVTQFDQDLEYQDQSGAINESLSDIFGSMAKQYFQKENFEEADWLIGHKLMIGDQYSLRSMKQPGSAYKDHPAFGDDPQPATMDAYNYTKQDNGGVHINSGIPNYAFYLMTKNFYEIDSSKYAYSWESTGPIWYQAKNLLSPTATFDDLVKATVKVAEDIFGYESLESKAVKYAWADVKLLDNGTQPGEGGGNDSKCCQIL